MALLAWFNTKEYIEVGTKDVLRDEHPAGLTLGDVLNAHAAWHQRLIEVMHGAKDVDFELTKVYQDNHSFLGRWLQGEANTLFGTLPEYDTVCKAYAEFHGWAGVVLGQHQIGNKKHAQQLLKTKYRTASNKVKMEVARLFNSARLKHSIHYQLISLAA